MLYLNDGRLEYEMNIKKTSQSEITHLPKQRGHSFWLTRFALLLGVPLLLYYGYCWGWWGRSSLLLQYIFQCGCPTVSNEARYPDEVDVIVPACPQARVRLSPSGHFLHVREWRAGITTAYLLDLQTMQRIDVTNQPLPSFLTDDLWFIENGFENYILDRITGMQYPTHKFRYSRPDAQINGETNLTLLVENLKQAEQVFLIGASTDTVVALPSDFRTDPERNFIANRFDLPDFNMERFLQENNISYQTVLPDFPGEVVSPDGRFIARHDGIYLVDPGEKIVEGYSASRFFREYYSVRGWTYDGSSVIYSMFLNPCLIEIGFFSDDPACYFKVPQPVILLKVPQEFLLPTETP